MFPTISEVWFVYNRCRRCIFNKLTHLGNKTKRLSFLNMLIMHLFPSFTSKYWCLDVLEQHKNYLIFFFAFPECPSALYGPNCNLFCCEHCQNRTCNQSNGYCLACDGARFGNLCENEQPLKGTNINSIIRSKHSGFECEYLMNATWYIIKRKLNYMK